MYGPATWPAAGPWATPRTNPLSVVALVTGVIGLVPVAIPVGIVALVRLRRLPERGRGLAIGGLAAAACWLVLAGLVVVGLTLGSVGGSSGIAGRVAQAGSTEVGTCLLSGDAVAAAVPCTDTHDQEVFRVDVFQGGDFPGRSELTAEADDACYAAYRSYVGRSYEDSAYDYAFYVPDAAEWHAGERRFVCIVVPSDSDTLPGVVAGSRT